MLIHDIAGCKRRIFDPDYLDALHKKNVELRNEGIQEFTETGVIGSSGDEYRTSHSFPI